MAPRPVFSEEQTDFLHKKREEFVQEQRTRVVRFFFARTYKEFLKRWPVGDIDERKKLRVRIANWFYNSVRSKKTAGAKKHGPVITLIPKRSMQPSQAYHSLYKDELKPILDEVYKTHIDSLAEGETAPNRFGFDNEVVRVIYSLVTDPDIQARVENHRLRLNESDGTNEDQRLKEQEAAVKRLPKTCQVVADAIEREAGWYTTILVGGRDPVTGGTLAYVYHSGKNPDGEKWGDLSEWNDIQDSWESFVEECFPLEKTSKTSSEKIQDTVPGPKATKSKADAAPPCSKPATQTTKAAFPKSALAASLLGLLKKHEDVLQTIGTGDVSLSDSDQEEETTEREFQDVLAESSEDEPERDAPEVPIPKASTPARTKPAAKQSGSSKEKSEIDVTGLIEAQKNSESEGEGKDEVEHPRIDVPIGRSKAAVPRPAGQGWGVLMPSKSGPGEPSFTDDDESEYVEEEWQGISQGENEDDFHHPAVTETQPAPQPPAPIQSQTHLSKTSVSLEMPIFYRDAAMYLRGVSKERHWLNLVDIWLKLEEKFGYTDKDAGRLPKGSRPEEVGLWMQNARKYTRSPSLAGKALKVYVEKWKLWWAELQPRWRNTKVWPFERKSGSWEVLLKVGKNGVYVVILSLAWWMSALSKNPPSQKQQDEFLAVLDDVNWVFSQLIDPTAPLSPSPERKRLHGQLPKPTPKRRKRD